MDPHLASPIPAALLLLITTLFLLFRRRGGTKTLPPSPSLRLPILGHLHHLLLTSFPPHHALHGISRSLRHPIMHLSLGQIPTIVVSSASLARDVLKTCDHVFCDRPRLVSAQYLSFGWSDVTFSPYGKYWRNARRICVTELLSGRAVAGFGSVRREETERLVETVKGRVGTQVDLSELLFALANDVVCRAAFGRRFEGGGGGLVDVLTETQELFAGFCLGDFFPRWRWLDVMTGYRKRLERNLSDLRRVCDEIIQEHLMKEKEKEKGSDEGEDFVDVLLRVQRQEDLEVPITDDNLKALVMDMFVAGTDTTSSTLEWVMTELA
ncbi:Tryptamine 5-hydroxylase-like protein, partial [Drosera capensis]